MNKTEHKVAAASLVLALWPPLLIVSAIVRNMEKLKTRQNRPDRYRYSANCLVKFEPGVEISYH